MLILTYHPATPGFLTDRDRWAGTFDELLLDTPRTDTPQFLPEGPAPTGNWTPAPNLSVSAPLGEAPNSRSPGYGASGGDVRVPQHCSQKEGVCKGPEAMTAKQIRLVELFSALTSTPTPDITSMSNYGAQVYIRARWGEWIASQNKVTA